jgi:hypothetical protein
LGWCDLGILKPFADTAEAASPQMITRRLERAALGCGAIGLRVGSACLTPEVPVWSSG